MKPIYRLLLIAVMSVVPIYSYAQESESDAKLRLNSYIYGGGAYESVLSHGGAKLDIGAGCRINRYLYAGMNVGGPYLASAKYQQGGVSNLIFEMFYHFTGNLKFYVPIEGMCFTPFFDIKLGANLNIYSYSGFYMSYGIGADYKRMSVMLGYEGISSCDFDVVNYQDNVFGHAVFLSIGVRFGR
mgnify:FL=1